jgi:hypothetical protein
MTATDTIQSKKTLKVLLAVLGVVVALGLLVVFVVQPLLSGDDAAPGSASVPEPAAAEPEELPAADEPAGEPVPETFEVFSARDPFHQLIQRPATSSLPAGDTAGSTGSVGSTGSTDGTGSTSPSPGGSAQVGGTTVQLVDVFTDDDGVEKVLVEVNGTGYQVAEGESFAGSFRLLDISGSCATFLFGDSRFVLCEGESIRK